jgi:hypothetical protein
MTQLETIPGTATTAPTKTIANFVKKKDWPRIARIAASHSLDCQYRGPDGTDDYPIYTACGYKPPVRALKALLRAFPEAALHLGKQSGDWPLHAACRSNASLEVIRALVQAFPETTCRKPSHDVETVVRTLFESRTTTESNYRNENYNVVFWQKMQILLEGVSAHHNPRASSLPRNSVGSTDTGNGSPVVPVAGSNHSIESRPDDPTQEEKGQLATTDLSYGLHAAVLMTHLDCPPDLVAFALFKYPEHVSVRDCQGRLPLHMAVGPAMWTEMTLQQGKYVPREQQSIGPLVAVHPGAARSQDPNEVDGRYPLHTALANQHSWYSGVKELFEHAPEVLYMADPSTGLLPFQTAACPVRTNATVDLDIVFCLLRAQPGVLDSTGAGKSFFQDEECWLSSAQPPPLADMASKDGDLHPLLKEKSETSAWGTTLSLVASPNTSQAVSCRGVSRRISGMDVMRMRQVLEIRQHVGLANKRLTEFGTTGVRRCMRQQEMKESMKQGLQAAEALLRNAQTAEGWAVGSFSPQVYATAMLEASEGDLDMADAVTDLEARVVQHMHHMLSLQKQEAILRKQRRVLRKYLERCQAWLRDMKALRPGIRDFQAQNQALEDLYKETTQRQEAMIARQVGTKTR